MRASPVVPAAPRAGNDPLASRSRSGRCQERKANLDEAEKYFVAVGNIAGETDAARLNLAQVYYWQGKHREGKALFDDVLKSGKREPKLLIGVSQMLREVGSESDARTLAEEAYNSAHRP